MNKVRLGDVIKFFFVHTILHLVYNINAKILYKVFMDKILIYNGIYCYATKELYIT